MGNAKFQFEITLKKDCGNFEDDNTDINRFKKRIRTPFKRSYDIDDWRFRNGTERMCRHCFCNYASFTSKGGGFSSNFDINDEDNITSTTLNGILIDIHTKQANKGNISGQLAIEHTSILGFCNIIIKVTRNVGFRMTLKTKE